MPLKPFKLQLNSASAIDRHTHIRVTIRIPKQYHQEPIISNLISEHQLKVNIAAALLGANAREDGWFTLELQGTLQQIQSALVYLNDLDLEIWDDAEEESW